MPEKTARSRNCLHRRRAEAHVRRLPEIWHVRETQMDGRGPRRLHLAFHLHGLTDFRRGAVSHRPHAHLRRNPPAHDEKPGRMSIRGFRNGCRTAYGQGSKSTENPFSVRTTPKTST